MPHYAARLAAPRPALRARKPSAPFPHIAYLQTDTARAWPLGAWWAYAAVAAMHAHGGRLPPSHALPRRAQGDVAELFAQMSAMEAQYKAEIKDLMDKHLAEVEELEERHRAEVEALQQQLGEGGSGNGRGARARGGIR
jgi:hypothetical protein